MSRLALSLAGATLIALTPELAQAETAKPVAVCGYPTGTAFLEGILPAGGLAFEDRLSAPLPTSDYPRYAAVVWNDIIKEPGELGPTVAWDLSSNVADVADFLAAGGTVLITGLAVPVSTSKVLRKLGGVSEVAGIAGIAQAKPQGKIRIVAPEDPLFSGMQIAPEGYDWVVEGSVVAESATTGKVLAVATTSDGRELPFITVHSRGAGRLYWFGASPARLQKSAAAPQDKQVFEELLVKALGGDPSGIVSAGSASAAASVALPMQGPNGWGRVPLGKDESAPAETALAEGGAKTAWRKVEMAAGDPTELVSDGAPRAFIVLAQGPTDAAREAAELLRRSIREASGADLPILSEERLVKDSDGALRSPDHPELTVAVVIGQTKLGADLGIDAQSLPEEGFQIEVRGPQVFIVGRDLSSKGGKTSGTLFAVVDFLENHAGFRWLWPGPDGTVTPSFSSLSVPQGKVTDAPSLVQRRLRNYNIARRITAGLEVLSIPYEDHAARWQETAAWFRMMRTGSSQKIDAGHAFAGWYDKHHADHPDWFALQPDGSRSQVPVRETLCTSNAGLIKAASDQVLGRFADDPTLSAASASLNDGGQNDMCMCEVCRSLDPPGASPIKMRFRLKGRSYFVPYVSLSDRILDFYNGVAERVVAARPGSLVAAQAYSYYRSAPRQTPVHPSLVVFFVGLSFLERARHEADLVNWERWAALSERIVLRPNTLHAGHAFPAVFTSEAGRSLAHCYETGMVGADFDAVIHHWATQGLNYYVLAKLLWNPQADPDAIVDDYCKTGFGPAAPEIREYFSEIQKLTVAVAENAAATVEAGLRNEEDDVNARSRDALIEEFSKAYAGEKLARLREILARAAAKGEGNEAVLRRICFLSTGLDYAEVQSRFYTAVAEGRGSAALPERQDALRKLFKDDFLAVNVGYILWKELALLGKVGGSAAQ